ncbi:MAG: lytic transglycosylase domain-containing protein [Ignavibacteriales bacterium]|nr:lytic transglycosylase domain-containing protein [Ignavibacteriales bacterium]
MDKKKIYFAAGIVLIVILSLLSVTMSYLAFKERKHVQKIIIKTEAPEYKIFVPEIPEEMDFCGEKVPLELFDVHERMERELFINAHWESSTATLLKKSNRWFPQIIDILKKNGVPEDFKYLAAIESGLSNAVSSAGAAGFWQLMEPTAKKYGLEINEFVDERYNFEKATQAACSFLKEAHAKYGNWTLAAASYNLGINGIDKHIEKQRTKNYYNLYLVDETSRFVFRLLAMKEIFKGPKKFGYDFKEDELYRKIETEEVTVKKPIKDLALFAKQNNVNYKILKIFNPWLRNTSLPGKSGKVYKILIPKDGEALIAEE